MLPPSGARRTPPGAGICAGPTGLTCRSAAPRPDTAVHAHAGEGRDGNGNPVAHPVRARVDLPSERAVPEGPRGEDAPGPPGRSGGGQVGRRAELRLRRGAASRLNADGVPAQTTGKLWTASSLRGHAGRGTGILNNELLIGRLVWTCRCFTKNPETGKRVARLNPRDEWIVAQAPELWIVDDELWRAPKIGQEEIAGTYATAIAVTRRRRGATLPSPDSPLPGQARSCRGRFRKPRSARSHDPGRRSRRLQSSGFQWPAR